MDHFLVHLGKRASAVFGSSNVILGGARQLLEGLSIVFFKAGSFFEKSAKLLSNYHQLLIRLSCLSHMVSELQPTAWSNAGCHVKKGPRLYVCRTNWLTFAEAMLCFKRCSSEGIPCYRGKSASTNINNSSGASIGITRAHFRTEKENLIPRTPAPRRPTSARMDQLQAEREPRLAQPCHRQVSHQLKCLLARQHRRKLAGAA